MNRVFMTQRGIVQIVLIAPAVIEESICTRHGCSCTFIFPRVTEFTLSLRLLVVAIGGSPKKPLTPSYTEK